jgi:hypothetical protein
MESPGPIGGNVWGFFVKTGLINSATGKRGGGGGGAGR